jgi:hypothetical protein
MTKPNDGTALAIWRVQIGFNKGKWRGRCHAGGFVQVGAEYLPPGTVRGHDGCPLGILKGAVFKLGRLPDASETITFRQPTKYFALHTFSLNDPGGLLFGQATNLTKFMTSGYF